MSAEDQTGGRAPSAEPAGFSGWSLTLGRGLVLLIGFALAAALFAISAWMNVRFGRSLGVEETDRALYGAASLAADGFKALSPFLLIGLYRARRWLLLVFGAALWLLCVAWSVASAVGFAAETREAATAERRAALESGAALSERAARLERQIAALPPHRPAETVAAEIDAAPVPRSIWRRTDRCRDVTLPASLDACRPVLELRRELAVATDAQRLEAELAETRAALAGRPASQGRSADPQAAALAALIGGEPGGVRRGLALVMTGFIELGASLGFALVAIGAGALERGPRRAPTRKATIAQPASRNEPKGSEAPQPRLALAEASALAVSPPPFADAAAASAEAGKPARDHADTDGLSPATASNSAAIEGEGASAPAAAAPRGDQEPNHDQPHRAERLTGVSERSPPAPEPSRPRMTPDAGGARREELEDEAEQATSSVGSMDPDDPYLGPQG